MKGSKKKNVSHVKNEAADWRNGFVSFTFFYVWRRTNDLKVTLLYSHVWKWKNFCNPFFARLILNSNVCCTLEWLAISHIQMIFQNLLNGSIDCIFPKFKKMGQPKVKHFFRNFHYIFSKFGSSLPTFCSIFEFS